MYFSDEPISRELGISKGGQAELKRVEDYKQSIRSTGLQGQYDSMHQLHEKVLAALTADVNELGLAAGLVSDPKQAPKASFGVSLQRSGNSKKLLIHNIGSGAAENLEIIAVDPVDGDPLQIRTSEPFQKVHPGNEVNVMAIAVWGVAKQHNVKLRWSEGSSEFEDQYSVIN